MDSAVAVDAARVAVVSSRLTAFEGASADVLASMTDRQGGEACARCVGTGPSGHTGVLACLS